MVLSHSDLDVALNWRTHPSLRPHWPQASSPASRYRRTAVTAAVPRRAAQLFERGFQTRSQAELWLGDALAQLPATD